MIRDPRVLVEPTPWPPTKLPVDLRAFAQRLGPHRSVGKPTPGGFRQVACLRETACRLIEAPPLPVVGFLDGCQTSAILGRKDHRDIRAIWVAAGTTHGRQLLQVEELLAVLSSTLDEDLVRGAGPDMPVRSFSEVRPWDLAQAMEIYVDDTRRALELRALENAPATPGHYVVVDGSLPTTTQRNDCVGVIKSALETTWLQDPGLLPTKAGWRSPAMLLPAERHLERDRITAFLRLRDAGGDQSYGFSLIRLEVFADAPNALELLDRAGAMAMTQRQPLGPGGDPRGEVHLRGFKFAEESLRVRSPLAIEVLG